jgi:two-component system cell cycle response regulator
MQKAPLSILIVDGSFEDRQLYRRFLLQDNDCEYLIHETDNGGEALKLLQSKQFHCILLDYGLPDMDGIELLKKISDEIRAQRVPRILLAGQGNEVVAVDAMKNGATDYMVKEELTKDFFIRTIRNVIDSKNTENTLLDYFYFLETLIDTIPNPIFYKNTKGEYTGCNKAFESCLGLSRDAVIGKTVYEMAPGELAERYKEMDQKLFDNPGVQVYETQVRYADGTLRDVIFYEATFTNSYGNVGGLVGVMLDITDRKRMEENLKKTKEELESSVGELKKANQMIRDQQKSVIEKERFKLLLQLSGATAHELNQPLAVILGSIELLKLRKDYPSELNDRLNKIENAGLAMADIIKKIQFVRRDETIPYAFEDLIINLDQKVHILSIEDSDRDFEKICSIVKSRTNIVMSRAREVGEAIQELKTGWFDLVLLDYTLADNKCFDFLRIAGREGIEIPVIAIMGQGNEVVASQLIREGACDYIPKQMLSKKSLFRSISNAMERHRLKRDLKIATEKMAEMSIRDELTGLCNRRFFTEALERETARAKRYGADLSLCMIDIDHFKNINDVYGYPAGDRALSETAVILEESIRKSDMACRYGGEEFALILTNTGPDNAIRLSERFMRKLALHEFEYNSSRFKMTVSIGITSFDNSFSENSKPNLVERADKALYQAKEEGRNRIVVIK